MKLSKDEALTVEEMRVTEIERIALGECLLKCGECPFYSTNKLPYTGCRCLRNEIKSIMTTFNS